jgi:AcrR family transcriptional regulator
MGLVEKKGQQMPRPRFDKLDQRRKEKILETAAREFAEHGFDGASLNHILAAAGVSKGAAYYYFDGKADLFGTVLRHYWQHVLGHVDVTPERLTRETFWPVTIEVYRQALGHAFEQPWILPLVKSVRKVGDGKLAGALADGTLAELQSWTRSLLARGQELGAVRRDLPLDLLHAIVVAVDDASDHWMLGRWERMDRAEIEALTGRLLEMLRRALEPPAGGEGGP